MPSAKEIESLREIVSKIARPDKRKAVPRWMFNIAYTGNLKGRIDRANAKRRVLSSIPQDKFEQLHTLMGHAEAIASLVEALPYEIAIALPEDLTPDDLTPEDIEATAPYMKALAVALKTATEKSLHELKRYGPSERPMKAGRKKNQYAFGLAEEAADAFFDLSGKWPTIEVMNAKGKTRFAATDEFRTFLTSVFEHFGVEGVKHRAADIARHLGKQSR